MKKWQIAGLVIAVVLLTGIVVAEQMTFSTYYPAPYGVYNEMRARRMTVGSNYLDSSAFTVSDDNLIVEGKVGIGTTDPQAKLHVAGEDGVDGIMFPDDTIQTTAASGARLLAKVTLSANQSIPLGLPAGGLESIHKVNFNNVIFDPDGKFDTATNRYVPGESGYYQVNCHLRFTDSFPAGSRMLIRLFKDITQMSTNENQYSTPANPFCDLNDIVYLNSAADSLEIRVGHWGTSGTKSLLAGATETVVTFMKVAD